MSENSKTEEIEVEEEPESAQAASDGTDHAVSEVEEVTEGKETEAEEVEGEDENSPIEGRAWQVAQLAAQMVSRGGIYGRLDNEGWSWAEEFQIGRVKEAVRAAHLVLEIASRPTDERINASTLFQPSVAFNAREIAERFDEVGWPNLGETKVRERLREIRQCWEGSISTELSQGPKLESSWESAVRKIADAMASLAGDADVFQTINDFQKRATGLLQEIRAEIPPAPSSTKLKADRLQALHDWCFPEDVAERAKAGTLYRIHELLRFAEEQYDGQIGHAQQLHRFHQIADSDLQGELEKAEFWLPEPLRSRPLASLKPPFNRSSFNSPPTQESSFKLYNDDGIMDPSMRYPW